MKYFTIDYSLDEKIVGKDFPQSYKFINSYNPDAPKALFSLYEYYNTFPDYIPNLDGLMLAGSARLTDFISTAFNWNIFVVSERVKSVFEKHHLCPHRFYTLGLYKRKVKRNYFLLYIVSNYSEYVDYENSTFLEYSILNKKKTTPISIHCLEDLLQKRNILHDEKDIEWTIGAEKIVMGNKFDNKLDFFNLGLIGGATYVSERFKKSIESHGLTGWEFFPADHLIVED